MTGKYRGSAHRDCNIKVKLNHKISIVFQNLKKSYDPHLIMQELRKCNFKINVIRNGLEKYRSFNVNNKLIFINSFQFFSSLLDSLVETYGKNDLKYLCQEFDSNVLDLVEQKCFYPYVILNLSLVIVKILKENCKSKKSFIVS